MKLTLEHWAALLNDRALKLSAFLRKASEPIEPAVLAEQLRELNELFLEYENEWMRERQPFSSIPHERGEEREDEK
jgi:hypothetical protein